MLSPWAVRVLTVTDLGPEILSGSGAAERRGSVRGVAPGVVGTGPGMVGSFPAGLAWRLSRVSDTYDPAETMDSQNVNDG
jgi:hypothetical protein